MHLNRLGLRNFKKYRRAEIEFQDGLTGIVGRNGVGKSTLVEAIAWVLYGNKASNIKRDFLKNSNCSENESVEVALSFSSGKREITAIRAMRGKNLIPEAAIHIDGRIIATGSKEVDQKLEEILKISYQDFMKTFYARQKDLDNLLKEGGTGKREYLLKLLGLEDIRESSTEQIRFDLRKMENQRNILAGAVMEIGEVEKKIEDKSLDFSLAEGELARCKSIEAELAAEDARKRLELESMAEKRRNHDLLIERIAGIESKILEKKREIKTDEMKLEEIESSKRSLAELEPSLKRMVAVKARLDEIDPKRKEYEALLQKIMGTGIELDLAKQSLLEQQQHLNSLIEDRFALDKIKPLEMEYQEDSLTYGNLQILRDKHTDLQTIFQNEKIRLDSVKANISLIEEEINEILEAKSRMDEIQPLIEKFEMLQGEFVEARRDKDLMKQLNTLVTRRSALDSRSQRLDSQIAAIKKELTFLEDLDSKEIELRHQDRELDQLSTDLGNTLVELRGELRIEESKRSEAMRNLARIKGLGEGSNCPTCERPLREQYANLVQKYDQVVSNANERLADLKKRVQAQTIKIDGVIFSRSKLKISFDDLNIKKSRRAELLAGLRELEIQLTEIEMERSEITRSIEDLGEVSFDDKRFQALEKEIQDLIPYIDEYKFLAFKLEELPKREVKLDRLQKDKEILANKVDDINLEIKTLGYVESEYTALRTRLTELEGIHDEFKLLSQRIQEIPLIEKKVNSRKRELEKLGITIDSLKIAIEDLDFDPIEHERLSEELRVLAKAEESAQLFRARIAYEKETLDRLKDESNALNKLDAELLQLRHQLLSLDYDEELHQASKLASSNADERLKNARKEVSAKELRMGLIAGELQRLNQDEKRKQQYEQELKSISLRLQVIDVSRNIINRFLDHILLRIREDIANTAGQILEEVSDKYSILKIDDDFNILVEDGGEYYPITRYSGGETDMIAVSVRVAISEYLMRFGPEGESYSFLIMDEIFGSQDQEHRESMMSMLRNLEERFPQVIAISHISDVQGQFDNMIQVIEDETGNSRVEIV